MRIFTDNYYLIGLVIIKGLIPTNVKQGPLLDTKVFSLTPSHHECSDTERIVKEVKFCFAPLSRNQSASERNLTMEKITYYLFIICENYRFQDPIGFL